MWRRLIIGSLVLSSAVAIVGGFVLDIRFEPYRIDPADLGSMGVLAFRRLISALPALAWILIGWVLAALRPRNVLGWLFLAGGGMLSGAELLGSDFFWDYSTPEFHIPWQHRVADQLITVLLLGVPSVGLALYPQGRLPARWWRWPVGVALAGLATVASAPRASYYAAWCLVAPATLTIMIATLVRWRRAASPYRRPLAWFLACGFLPCAVAFVSYLSGHWLLSPSEALLVVPIGVAVGVLRYRLLGIDEILPRGLRYGLLTALVFIVYLVLTAVLSTALANLDVPGVVAAAIVAVGLAPAHGRLQRVADRLVYGDRDDPLRALAELSDSVAANDPLALVPAAVATVAAAVRADGAMIVTPDGTVLASTGRPLTRYLTEPLRFGGADIGELRVAEPPAGEQYLEVDHRLLTALAAQLAVVVSATNLTRALETERNRVVTATRDERDRLRRDLHDGLGPSLTGMSLGLQALSGRIGDADPPSSTLVERLRAEADTAAHDIRRIIDGLRPAVLDTVTLTQAVERHAGALDTTLPVEVTVATLPALAPDVEVAAYRIITEALNNAVRHAHARHAQVTISADEALRIAVSDDGLGMRTAGAASGVGLSSMRRRAEALGGDLAIRSTGGGTTITATLPLTSPHSD